MSGASAAAMLAMLRGMAGSEKTAKQPAAVVDADADDSDFDSALSARVARVEAALARFERGAFAAFDRLESRLEAFETRLDQKLAAVRLGGEGRPPKAHTKREWDAGVRGDVFAGETCRADDRGRARDDARHETFFFFSWRRVRLLRSTRHGRKASPRVVRGVSYERWNFGF